MGHKLGIFVGVALALLVVALASTAISFVDAELGSNINPLKMVYAFLQDLKYGDSERVVSTSDTLSATVIQLQEEVDELSTRISTMENPAKVYTTELLPITNIDCSNRNMVEAFLSGWCPHPARNVYFIEDSRVQEDSVIAISLDQNYDDAIGVQSVCGVINQDEFNFSFQESETGEVTMLEDLHGFIMKCDQAPVNPDTVLKYTIINS